MNIIQKYSSPNYNDRQENPIRFIILHYTDMRNADDAIARLIDPQAEVSAHYLISKEGQIFQLVDDHHRAWHAGVSSWQGLSDINTHSLGIELDNGGHTFGPDPFPEVQMDSLTQLLCSLIERHHLGPRQIWGHSDIAPLRKMDPGVLFPWETLAKKGLSTWPKHVQPISSLLSISEVQNNLCDIGYECPLTRRWDKVTSTIVMAFQRHYTPDDVTGKNSLKLGSWINAVREAVR